MTDVATAASTVEINDAVFCLAHFKEVVRPIILSCSFILPTLIMSILFVSSAPIAKLTCGRRTTDSSGYVSYLS